MKYNLNTIENYGISLFIITLVVAAYFSTGFFHFDEHFQIIEFANYKLGNISPDKLTWEFREKMRPTSQPTIALLIIKSLNLIELNSPFLAAFVMRLVSALLSGFTAILTYYSFKQALSNPRYQKAFFFLSFFLWFFVFNCVRFSSENWSASLFFIAFNLYFFVKRRKSMHYIGIGLLLGCSFLFRYQTGFMAFGFILWLIAIQKEHLKTLVFIISGILTSVALGTLLDFWFYNEYTFAPWNYLEQNLIIGRASGFGVQPWWWYLTESIIKAVPPFSLIFWIGLIALSIKKRKSPVLWVTLPFLLVHLFIGHKEIRFLFPLIFFLPYLAITGYGVLDSFVKSRAARKSLTILTKLFWITNTLLLLFVILKPADPHIGLFQKIHAEYKAPITLYYIGENPYDRVADIQFYKRANLTIGKFPNDSSKLKENYLLAHLTREQTEPIKGNLIYATFPEWVLKFNLNNWQRRSRIWKVYEVSN